LRDGLGEDFTFYLEVLFTEQEGFNLRNVVSHGMLGTDQASQYLAATVFDVLLRLQPLRLVASAGAEDFEAGEEEVDGP